MMLRRSLHCATFTRVYFSHTRKLGLCLTPPSQPLPATTAAAPSPGNRNPSPRPDSLLSKPLKNNATWRFKTKAENSTQPLDSSDSQQTGCTTRLLAGSTKPQPHNRTFAVNIRMFASSKQPNSSFKSKTALTPSTAVCSSSITRRRCCPMAETDELSTSAPAFSFVVAAFVSMACLRGLGFQRIETSAHDFVLKCRTLQVLVQKSETM